MKILDKNIKRFPLRLEENIHREIKVAAFNADVSIHQFIMEAVKDKLKKEGNK
ncbi:transcriptional repressor [Bacillus phage Pascal]|uniref:Transcriptional repressor n=1 Tax=Bacillus phage Pascal TaxID=1540092 RepID=A0A0A0RNS0_9CAUD|nr:transcriptional repressor [Bacillus phage Pascal]AIW03672.1 transcriptional repressor [Bacillus phage Pascal]